MGFIRLLKLEGQLRIAANPANALYILGWFNSVNRRQSIDADGNPLPWLSYPAIAFIHERIKRTQVVFEYGSGGSTFWFAQRCQSINSVEHHPEWHSNICNRKPTNANIIFSPLEHKEKYMEIAFGSFKIRNCYSDTILTVATPDIVIVDGIYRNACVAAACEVMGDASILVYDNTDFPGAQEGVDYLKSSGWRQLRFVGMSPIFDKLTETSVFYRSGNCWNI